MRFGISWIFSLSQKITLSNMCDKDIICEEIRYLKVKRYRFSENWEMIGDLQEISANKSHFLLEDETCKKERSLSSNGHYCFFFWVSITTFQIQFEIYCTISPREKKSCYFRNKCTQNQSLESLETQMEK